MKLHLNWMLAVALAACMPAVAAETATITSSVNVRSGPDRSLPTVTWLMGGTRVTLVGCVPNWRWCDVIAGRDRGWVYSRYLSVPFQGSAVVIANGGPNLGLPVTEFELGPYWDEHYQRRLFFPQKARWQTHWDQRRAPPEWREPTPRR
jgi:uncharacterized protein YraI